MFLTILLLLFTFLVLPKSAHAYLDPGTGSYVIQMLIGASLGGVYLVKTFWKNIVTFITNLFKKPQKK